MRSPSKSYIVGHHNEAEIRPFFNLAVAKRPDVELFDVKNDPYCLINLAGKPDYAAIEQKMKGALMNVLKKSGDPRVTGPDKEIFDSYLRYSPLRDFPPPGNE